MPGGHLHQFGQTVHVTHALTGDADQLGRTPIARQVRLDRHLHIDMVEDLVRLRDYRQPHRLNAEVFREPRDEFTRLLYGAIQ